jgi:serine/threonine protein kinase
MDALQPGDPRQVGAYRLIGRLGEGGMGQVYLGVSPGGKKVAVKVVRASLTDETEYRQRFEREVRAARQVGGFHTAVVVDADPAASPPWMATDYVPGPSLQDMLMERGPLALPAATALGAALAEGLAGIHDAGLVHRDLKPGNIIMAANGPKIIDFGIALPTSETRMTRTNMVLGTYTFMSPEQFRAERATPASDVFALGCVLAYAATGLPPFDAPALHQVMYRVLTGDPTLDGIPPSRLLGVVRACLAKEPERRPSPRDVLEALRDNPTLVFQLEDPLAIPLADEPGGVVAIPEPPGPAAPGPQPPAPGPVPAPVLDQEQEPTEGHEGRSVTQQAKAAPGSVVIQIAGNAKFGDRTLLGERGQ